MNLTLKLNFSNSLSFKRTFHTDRGTDSLNAVTQWLASGHAVNRAIEDTLQALPDSGEGVFNMLWNHIKYDCDSTFAKGRMVDVNQVVSASYLYNDIKHDGGCSIDRLVIKTLTALTFFYCEVASS